MEKKIFDLNLEYREWVNRIKFYEDDAKIMEARISEVNAKNTLPEVRAMIEHFQNQLILQRDALDLLKQKCREQIGKLEDAVNKNPVASDHRSMEQAENLKQEILRAETIFNDLRKELIHFLSRWM